MKLIISQQSLARTLAVVGRSVATRSTLPVLSCVLLDTGNRDALTVSATNLEIGTTITVEVDMHSPGAVAVPARLLTDFVSGLPAGEPVTLELRGMTLNLKCGRYEANIKGIDAQEFPAATTVTDGVAFGIRGGDLKTMIERVAIAAAKEESRPVLCGVCCETVDKRLTMAAADGYRLAVDGAPIEADPDDKGSAVIPATTLLEVRRVCGDDGEVGVVLGLTQAQFTMGDVTIVSQLLEGNFPDYQQIIPKAHNTRVIISTAGLIQALKMAGVFAKDSSNTIHLSAVEDRLTVSAASAEHGDNVSQLDAAVEGPTVTIGFNVRYLLDALGGVHSPDTVMEMRGVGEAVVVRETGEASDYRCIVMPVHIAR